MTPEERKRLWQERQAKAERQRIWAERQTAQQQPPGWLESVKIGAERGYRKYLEPAISSIGEAAAGIMYRGDPRPALQMAKEAGMGTVRALAGPPTASALDAEVEAAKARARAAGLPVASDTLGGVDVDPLGAAGRALDPGLREAQAQRRARYQASPEGRRSRERLTELDARAALDPSITGKAVRGASEVLTGAAPTLATAIATRGILPTSIAAGLQSAGDPSMMGPQAAAGVLPLPVGKAVAPLLRRVRAGRGIEPVPPGAPTRPLSSIASADAPTTDLPPVLEADLGASAPSVSSRAQGVSMRGPSVAETAALEVADPSLVTKAERTPVLEVLSAARKAGLLTSAKTHIRNIAGTGLFQLSEEVARIPGAVIDALMSRVTKQRTLTGPSLESMRRSFHEAATKGWQEAKEIWRKGITQADIERLGLNQEINSGSKTLDKYINSVFRSLSIEDKLIHTYAARRALESRARALALTEIRQGKLGRGEYGKRFKEILENPPEDLAAGAVADAEVAVFTNENLVSKFLAGGRREIEKLPGGRAATFGVDMVLPFTKTPSNIIARMLDYAGFGAAKETTKAIARRIVGKSMTADQQRAFATQWGRASIGSGLIALGYIGHRDGWLTGFIEDDLGRRERDEAAGRIPGAIKIGDRWHQILGAAPLASLLVIGATLAREVDQEREGSGLLPTLETFGQAIGEQPLLIGSKQVAESLTKPGTTGERFLGGAIGSFVPTALSDASEAFDPAQRETRGAGITGAAQKRIPGLRNLLPDAVDVFGQPRQDYGPGQALFDPTRATTDVAANTPLLRELVRLDLGLTGFRKDGGETTADFRRRVQSFGELYSNYGAQLLDSTLYRDASDGDRREVFKTLNSRAKHIINEGQLNRAQSLLNPASLFAALRQHRERQEAERRKTNRR